MVRAALIGGLAGLLGGATAIAVAFSAAGGMPGLFELLVLLTLLAFVTGTGVLVGVGVALAARLIWKRKR